MPDVLWKAFGFFLGWLFFDSFRRIFIPNGDFTFLRLVVFFFASVTFGVILLCISVNEARNDPAAFDYEQALWSSRWFHFTIFYICGSILGSYDIKSAFRKKPVTEAGPDKWGSFLSWLALRKKTGVEEAPEKSGSFLPWLAAALPFVFIAVFLLTKPDLFNRISSLKAGEVEADFSASSSTIIRSPVDLLDIVHDTTLDNWADFKLYTPQSPNFRTRLYEMAGADTKRVRFSQVLFDRMITPVFNAIECMKKANVADEIQKDPEFDLFADRLAGIIIASVKGPASQDALSPRQQLDAFAALNEITTAIGEHWHQSVCRWTMQSLDFTSFARELPTGSAPLPYLWDPYVIEAVADVIGFAKGQRAEADFLEDVSRGVLDRDEACRPNPCRLPTPGPISLALVLTASKYRGQGPWPFDQEVDDLASSIERIEEVLRAVSSKDDSLRGLTENELREIKNRYIRSRFVHLSTGLEIYNQRTLQGHQMNARHRANWRIWLDEVKQILRVVENIQTAKTPLLPQQETRALEEAAYFIEQKPEDLSDAESAAALSAVLLPRQDGAPSSSDCLDARTLQNHLLHIDLIRVVAPYADHIKATYKGFIEQIGNRIETECS